MAHWRTRCLHKKMTRNALAREQDGLCYYCRSLMKQDVTIEHVKPRSRGGPDVKTNMKAACRHCNRTRGNMQHGQFWKLIRVRKRPPEDVDLWLVWMRRQLNLRTGRAVRRICRCAGMGVRV